MQKSSLCIIFVGLLLAQFSTSRGGSPTIMSFNRASSLLPFTKLEARSATPTNHIEETDPPHLTTMINSPYRLKLSEFPVTDVTIYASGGEITRRIIVPAPKPGEETSDRVEILFDIDLDAAQVTVTSETPDIRVRRWETGFEPVSPTAVLHSIVENRGAVELLRQLEALRDRQAKLAAEMVAQKKSSEILTGFYESISQGGDADKGQAKQAVIQQLFNGQSSTITAALDRVNGWLTRYTNDFADLDMKMKATGRNQKQVDEEIETVQQQLRKILPENFPIHDPDATHLVYKYATEGTPFSVRDKYYLTPPNTNYPRITVELSTNGPEPVQSASANGITLLMTYGVNSISWESEVWITLPSSTETFSNDETTTEHVESTDLRSKVALPLNLSVLGIIHNNMGYDLKPKTLILSNLRQRLSYEPLPEVPKKYLSLRDANRPEPPQPMYTRAHVMMAGGTMRSKKVQDNQELAAALPADAQTMAYAAMPQQQSSETEIRWVKYNTSVPHGQNEVSLVLSEATITGEISRFTMPQYNDNVYVVLRGFNKTYVSSSSSIENETKGSKTATTSGTTTILATHRAFITEPGRKTIRFNIGNTVEPDTGTFSANLGPDPLMKVHILNDDKTLEGQSEGMFTPLATETRSLAFTIENKRHQPVPVTVAAGIPSVKDSSITLTLEEPAYQLKSVSAPTNDAVVCGDEWVKNTTTSNIVKSVTVPPSTTVQEKVSYKVTYPIQQQLVESFH